MLELLDAEVEMDAGSSAPHPSPVWNPSYLFHLFKVIIQFGPFGPTNLLADQLLGTRRKAREGTGEIPAGLWGTTTVPVKDANSGTGRQMGYLARPGEANSAGVSCDPVETIPPDPVTLAESEHRPHGSSSFVDAAGFGRLLCT